MKPSNPAKITPSNIKRFIQGWIRYILYKLTYRKTYLSKVSDSFSFLPKHKAEQFEWRLIVANKDCIKSGACVICGCQTPQLQMSDSTCEGKCYPEMMDEVTWNKYKKDNLIKI